MGARRDRLPNRELIRISLYWLGLSSIFAGLNTILTGRLEFTGLVDKQDAGRALFLVSISGAVIAMIVQPTIGSISDYTISRWGRRKPYILIGSILDIVFLVGIASSNTLVALAAFIALLQFSSNFAQGPFQGYVPDLVPAPQVGTASALVGLMQVLGNVAGFVIGAIATATNQFELGLIALGVLELSTMLSVVIRVREGPPPKSRAGRSWRAIAAEAWGTDILAERSFLWLVASRLAILMGGSVLVQLATFYLSRSMGLNQTDTGIVLIPLTGLVAVGTVISVVPAARISDRVGRKPVIWVSCAVGGVGTLDRRRRPDPGRRLPRGVALRRLRRDLPGGRLGAHDRHHPEGIDRPVHGVVERRHRVGGRAGLGLRRHADGPRRWSGRGRPRAAGRARVRGRPARRRRDPAPAGRRAATRGSDWPSPPRW